MGCWLRLPAKGPVPGIDGPNHEREERGRAVSQPLSSVRCSCSARASCPRSHGPSWRHSMVTPWARVSGLLGEKVVAVVPVVMPLALAQLTAAW